MFRKPRESGSQADKPVRPSIGRPPTPPATPVKTPFTLAAPPSAPAPKMALTKTISSKPKPLPAAGRQLPTGSAKKPTTTAKTKPNGPANGSILSFFKKTDGPPEDGGLFVGDRKRMNWGVQEIEKIDPSPDVRESEDESSEEARFNESGSSVKKRKTSVDTGDALSLFGESPVKVMTNVGRRSGPFMEGSDSENEDGQTEGIAAAKQEPELERSDVGLELQDGLDVSEAFPAEQDDSVVKAAEISRSSPSLVREETDYGPGVDEFKDFEGMDGFYDDPFEGGDEFLERRYMEEQARLEKEENEKHLLPAEKTVVDKGPIVESILDDGPSCPICSVNLTGISEQDAGIHVNNCLDGNPSPLPERQNTSLRKLPWLNPDAMTENTASVNQYKRFMRAPKPGQANPFSYGESTIDGSSAFNKLMSGHAEDAAWAEAAAFEHASRGKPSYQRTCPFYKILPGLSICVDAFRYGAVEGCKAYFLSHFHSDHYVGLTSHWAHGPIYCSKVTANLVKQQLHVDPKFVIALEFDQQVEVSGTKGVKVMMIPANHCPGSSLFLFENTAGKKSNGEPRVQRILHCGDFRACRQHVEHPLLMPDVQCKVTGKTKEQKIDVCYLDTTYLSPKYAFPSQDSVVKACADMCVSLSRHTIDENDGWEQMKRQRAGDGMVKFVLKGPEPETKAEEADDNDMKLDMNPNTNQQIIRTNSLPNEKNGRGRLLVVVGTYSIGKERICLAIAKALDSKIYAPASKQRIVAALEDPELSERLTSDPRVAQVHMTPLFEIRAETLDEYLKEFFPHFTRAVGFRPTGWNYRPPSSRFVESPTVQTVLNSDNWKSAYGMKEMVPQRGSSSRASCFGVPYSEHSSFRELTMFCCALRIERIIPTVNVGSAKSRERMKTWCERWSTEKRKNGLWKLPEDGSW